MGRSADELDAIRGGMLTLTQLDILRKMADGWTSREIADSRQTTVWAVRNTLVRIRAKLEATTSEHAIAIGFRRGFLK